MRELTRDYMEDNSAQVNQLALRLLQITRAPELGADMARLFSSRAKPDEVRRWRNAWRVKKPAPKKGGEIYSDDSDLRKGAGRAGVCVCNGRIGPSGKRTRAARYADGATAPATRRLR